MFSFIDPDAAEEIKKITIEATVNTMKGFNAPVEVIAASVEEMEKTDQFSLGSFTINFKSYEVISESGEKTRLTQRQLMLLRLLIEKRNQVVSRQEILEKIWGYDVYPSTRTIDNVILAFRKIFEKNANPHTYFKSIRGVGYKLTP